MIDDVYIQRGEDLNVNDVPASVLGNTENLAESVVENDAAIVSSAGDSLHNVRTLAETQGAIMALQLTFVLLVASSNEMYMVESIWLNESLFVENNVSAFPYSLLNKGVLFNASQLEISNVQLSMTSVGKSTTADVQQLSPTLLLVILLCLGLILGAYLFCRQRPFRDEKAKVYATGESGPQEFQGSAGPTTCDQSPPKPCEVSAMLERTDG